MNALSRRLSKSTNAKEDESTTTTTTSENPSSTTMPERSKSRTQVEESPVPACYVDTHGVMTTTTNDLPGYRVTKMLGTIYGITVRSRNWGADIGGFLKSSVGGELRPFTTLMYTARNEAMDRMVGECMGRGGNAVLGVRMDIAAESVWSQICAYGTAAVVEKIEEDGDGEKKSEKV